MYLTNEVIKRIEKPKYISIKEEDSILYSVNFDSNDTWLCELIVRDIVDTFTLYDGEECTEKTTMISLFFAPNEEYLNLYKEEKKIMIQKFNMSKLEVNKGSYTINLNGDILESFESIIPGFMGVATELMIDDDLTGVVINMTTDTCSKEVIKKILNK